MKAGGREGEVKEEVLLRSLSFHKTLTRRHAEIQYFILRYESLHLI